MKSIFGINFPKKKKFLKKLFYTDDNFILQITHVKNILIYVAITNQFYWNN